jgi:glycosyltransferase involved in cell wall biosynthesis
MLLSILIPTLPERKSKLDTLLAILNPQLSDDIEVLFDDRNRSVTTGEKRNALLEKAIGDYVVFIDDDDTIAKNYINQIMVGILKKVDCCSLIGIINESGVERTFLHSIKYNRYYEENNVYYRFPNHLNCIKASIAKQFTFPNQTISEDTAWATKIHQSGLLKREYEVKKVLYYYTPSK